MSWPLTVVQTLSLSGVVLLVCAVVFAEMCVRAIDQSLDQDEGT